MYVLNSILLILLFYMSYIIIVKHALLQQIFKNKLHPLCVWHSIFLQVIVNGMKSRSTTSIWHWKLLHQMVRPIMNIRIYILSYLMYLCIVYLWNWIANIKMYHILKIDFQKFIRSIIRRIDSRINVRRFKKLNCLKQWDCVYGSRDFCVTSRVTVDKCVKKLIRLCALRLT